MRNARTRTAMAGLLGAVLALSAGAALAARGGRSGSLASGFGQHGVTLLGNGTHLLGVATQRDGKAVAVGESVSGSGTSLVLARVTSSGKLDRSFAGHGFVHGPTIATGQDRGSLGRAVAIQRDGKIVVVGTATDRTGTARDGLLIERYTAGGRIDRGFGSGGIVRAMSNSSGDGYAVAVAGNGAIVATGAADAFGSGNGEYPRALVVRVDSHGRPDHGLAGGGSDVIDLGPFSSALAVAVQRDGKIVIAGSQAPGLQVTSALIARLSSRGALDGGFNGHGAYVKQYARGASFSSFNALSLAPGGKIIVAGSATSGQRSADAIVARFTGGGHPDGSFGSAGVARATSASGFTPTGTTVPGATGVVVTPRGVVLASGEQVNGVVGSLAVWGFSSRGRPGGFGSRGIATLRASSGQNSEGAALALASGGRSVVVAGDQNPPFAVPYRGLFAAFNS